MRLRQLFQHSVSFLVLLLWYNSEDKAFGFSLPIHDLLNRVLLMASSSSSAKHKKEKKKDKGKKDKKKKKEDTFVILVLLWMTEVGRLVSRW